MPCFEPVEVPNIESLYWELSDQCHPSCFDPCQQAINNQLGAVNLSCGVNLLLNPGNEMDLIDNEIPYWAEIIGNDWTQGNAFTGPAPDISGASYFWHSSPIDAELAQIINLAGASEQIDAGNATFEISGWIFSGADSAQIVVDFLDSNLTILDSYEGTIFDHAGWQYESNTFIAPVGTRAARFRLIGDVLPSATVSDVAFDDLSFVYVCL